MEDLNNIKFGRLLGSGSFGSVYEARLGEEGERVAVKVLREGAEETFEAESLLLEMPGHANLVRTIAAMTNHAAHNIVMEMAGERTLLDLIDSEESLSLESQRKFSLDVARALEFIHGQGQVHMDIKPANVLVTSEDTCKLADFGCCQQPGNATTPGSLLGTYAYMAPEVIKNELPSTTADIYSFGICIWQMIKREWPYGNQNDHAIIYGVVAYGMRPDLSKDEGGAVQEILVRRCWQAEAGARPTASEIIKSLSLLPASKTRGDCK